MRKTKIICTLGPAVDDYEVLKKLYLGGMSCARINFSHGTHEEQLVRINRVKDLAKDLNRPIPILLDTKGPEIRVGVFSDGSIELETGDLFTLYSDLNHDGTKDGIGLTYPDLAKDVKIGTKILIDDGKIGLEVVEIKGLDIVCKVNNPGKVSNRKSINVPNVAIKMIYLSQKDKEDLAFGVKCDVDYVAASFVRCAQDVIDLRDYLKSIGGERIEIISKIENAQGIDNLDEIIAASDGVMVARGDMGVEVDYKYLPSIQKEIIKKCFLQGKIAVTATQMLETMTSNPRPTRAEVSDVANACYDYTVATMLSGESAAGLYPIESVSAMNDILVEAECAQKYDRNYYNNNLDLGAGALSSICNAAVNASYQVQAKAIICVTMGGITAKMLSAYRPSVPIICVTVDSKSARQLGLYFGTYAIESETHNTTDEIIQNGINKALESGLVKKGDTVVITSGSATSVTGTDMMKIQVI